MLKEVKALLPVASLWASLDYKSVAYWPIMVSRILLLTKLISEIKCQKCYGNRVKVRQEA